MKEIERLAEEAMKNHRRGFTVEWPVAPEDLESAYETLMTQFFNLVERFNELEAALSPRPIEEAPRDTPVLVKHKLYGWIKAYQSSAMLASDNDESRKHPWTNNAFPDWWWTTDLEGWLPLPSVGGEE